MSNNALRKSKEQKANQDHNKELRAELQKRELNDEGDNFLKLKLWRELFKLNPMGVQCPYTGEKIGQERLFQDVEIDHILPLSRMLDDGNANKVLCITSANRDKGDRTPYEAFGTSPGCYRWGGEDGIESRLRNLPENRRWRFAPNAMQLHEEKYGGDFLARHLTYTAYISRIARE